MDNPARTALHFAEIDKRRETLGQRCADLLSGCSDFVLEIGCGNGHFLTAYAQAHPAELCLGIDIEEGRIERAERKRLRSGLAGLHFLHADIRDLLLVLPENAKFSAVYLLFPDPWPKKRHHKHRLLQPALLARIAEKAALGARLYFRTDYEPYFNEARAVVEAAPEWRLTGEPWEFEAPTLFQERAPRYSSLRAVRVR